MRLRLACCALCAFLGALHSYSQISSFPWSESFDGAPAPALPAGWNAAGFTASATASRSTPNCISATGNTTAKSVTSAVFDFTHRIPDRLVYWERRSGTAAAYHLEILASMDGVNFILPLARFDTISSTSGYVQRIVNLAGSGLQMQPAVQFQWHLLTDNPNTTGVLRIDDVGLTMVTAFDVACSALHAAPFLPDRKDSLSLSTSIQNNGSLAASGISVRFYADENLDGLAESGEQFSEIDGLILAAGDSATVTAAHPPERAGEYRFMARVDFPQDEMRSNDTARCAITVGCAQGDVLVNEFMYAPAGDEPEWIEMMNVSPDTVNLKNWRVSDSNTGTKTPVTTSDVFLPPDSYAVIAKDPVFSSVHPGIPFLAAGFGSLNNTTPDAVVLYDPRLRSVDSVFYQPGWGGQNGRSLERIDGGAASVLSANWATLQDSLGSTPGRINSTARMDYDLAIASLTQGQRADNGVIIPSVTVVVRNLGRRSTDSVVIDFSADTIHSGDAGDLKLLQKRISSLPLLPLDSISIVEDLPQLPSGTTHLNVVVDSWRDERMRNNAAVLDISRSYEPLSLVINEIMYDPESGQNEWIELFNRSRQTIDLCGWTFHDRPTASGSVNAFTITSRSLSVRPGAYCLIAADSSMLRMCADSLLPDFHSNIMILNCAGGFGFNIDGDALVLKDCTGQTIDSVIYQSSFGGRNGCSLERIDVDASGLSQANWGSAQNSSRCTPGKINSIARLNDDLAIVRLMQTRTISGGRIVPGIDAVICNAGRRTAENVSLQFHGDRNLNGYPDAPELLQNIALGVPLQPLDSIVISAQLPEIASGESRILVHIDYAWEERPGNNSASISLQVGYEPLSLVINEIMFDPLDGQNEWVELFNKNKAAVDLSGWTFNDRPTSSGVNCFHISSVPAPVPPGGFAVVAADSSLFRVFSNCSKPDTTVTVLVLNRAAGFSFNSDGDAIVLKDLIGQTIDSVEYSARWHHPDVTDTRGRSLERVNPCINSNDARNWSTCTCSLGGTPGANNSVLARSAPGGAVLSITPNPFSPDGDGQEDFCIIHYNLPMSTSTMNIHIYDLKGRIIRTLANGELAGREGEIVWNGLSDAMQRARIGVYIIFFEASDRSTGRVVTSKAVAIIASKL